MINQFILAAVEGGLNPLLQTDRVALGRLAGLAGQVVEVRVNGSALRLYLIPHGEGLQLAKHWEAVPACTLTASAGQLLQLALNSEKNPVLHQPGVSIEGNSGVLMELASILEDLQLDWPYLLQQWLGPLAAGLLSGGARAGSDWIRSGGASLKANLADYLAEESRMLVGNNEAQLHFAQLEQLKLQLDRLEARVGLITQRIST